MKKSNFSEIRTDHVDHNGVTYIDGYRTEDDNEQGTGIGYIMRGEVYWCEPEFQFDEKVKEAVAEILKEGNKEVIGRKEFVNGFSCWVETHYEMCAEIHWQFMKSDENNIATLVREAHDAGGHGFLYLLAEAMTDEFENEYKGVTWGEKGNPDYFPTIEKFQDRVLAESLESHRYLTYMY